MAILLPTLFFWLGLTALAFCFAVLVFRLPSFATAHNGAPSDAIFSPGIWRLFGIGIALIALSSIAELAFRAADMSGSPIENVFPVLPTVIERSHYGTVWLVRIAGLLVLGFGALIPGRYRESTAVRYVMLAVIVVVAGTLSASGHPSDEGDFTVKELMDVLHLEAACVWAGGIFVLSLLVIPSFTKRGDFASLAEVTRKFSTVAGYAVVVVIATAIYNVRDYVGDFASLWKTAYGITAVAKVVLLYFLLLLGAFNRYVSVPLLRHVAGVRIGGIGFIAHVGATLLDRFRGQLSDTVASVFRKAVLLEALLMVLVLLGAALLRHETPPRHLRHLQHEATETMQQAYPINFTLRH